MDALTAGAAVVHLGLLGTWTGAMGYSLLVVQPRAAAHPWSDDDHEAFLFALAHGNRWRVVALIAAILASGAVWTAGGVDPLVQAARGVALLAATGLFVHVSWRHWPRRVFALADERVAARRGLRRVAWTMAVLVGGCFASGLVLLAARSGDVVGGALG